MPGLTPEQEHSKRAMYEAMSPRGRKMVDKMGYDKWDPFEAQIPKDPIDIRRHKGRWTTQGLTRMFLQQTKMEKYSNAYGRGVFEMCMGLINDDDRIIAMYEFAIWYRNMLEKEGIHEQPAD